MRSQNGCTSDVIVDQDRRMSRQQKSQKLQQFVDYKRNMKFKLVDRQFVANNYSMRKTLGTGAFGTVKLCMHRKTQMPCAIKFIKKESLRVHEVYQQLNKNELEVLEETQHPHITRIFELLEDERNYYIVAELMSGGNLLEKIQEQRQFNESKAANVVAQVLHALNYMHGMNIMHRDLKPENILCEKSSDVAETEIHVKLTDFGFATKYDPNGRQHTLSLGSPLYMAPELCKEIAYDNKVDVWSTGVITYILLAGRPPFYDKNSRQTKEGIYQDIINSTPDYKVLDHVSAEATDFIKSALNKDPAMRPSIQELIESPWITKYSQGESLDQERELDLSHNLAAFAKTSIFQSGVCSIMANLMTEAEDLGELRTLFTKWDLNHDGYITMDELEQNMQEVCNLFNLDEPDVRKMM